MRDEVFLWGTWIFLKITFLSKTLPRIAQVLVFNRSGNNFDSNFLMLYLYRWRTRRILIRAFDFYSLFSFVGTKLFMPGVFLVSSSFQETFLLSIGLLIVKLCMYLSEVRKWAKERELKYFKSFIIIRFCIHNGLLKISAQLLCSSKMLKSLKVDQG